jgi:hypothetical protein
MLTRLRSTAALLSIVFLCAIVLFLVLWLYTRGSAPDRFDDLLTDISKAKDQSQQLSILEAASLSEHDLSLLLERAENSQSVELRTFSAVALAELKSDELFNHHWNKLVADPWPEAQRIAWLRAVERRHELRPDEVKMLSASNDFVLRSIAVLVARETAVLDHHFRDESPFVRAVVARRLGVGDASKGESQLWARALLEILLIDSDELVRSNALLTIRSIHYYPTPIIRALVMDNRRNVMLEELFDPADPDASMLRAKYHLSSLTEASLRLLGTQCIVAVTRAPKPLFSALLPPLNQHVSVAWAAADLLAEIDPNQAKIFFKVARKLTKDMTLSEGMQSFSD